MDVSRQAYQRWARGDGAGDDSWGDVTPEPGGVPAMWIEPHGAAQSRVIVAFHGGGFAGGSLHTHRKRFGHLAKATRPRCCSSRPGWTWR